MSKVTDKLSASISKKLTTFWSLNPQGLNHPKFFFKSSFRTRKQTLIFTKIVIKSGQRTFHVSSNFQRKFSVNCSRQIADNENRVRTIRTRFHVKTVRPGIVFIPRVFFFNFSDDDRLYLQNSAIETNYFILVARTMNQTTEYSITTVNLRSTDILSDLERYNQFFLQKVLE